MVNIRVQKLKFKQNKLKSKSHIFHFTFANNPTFWGSIWGGSIWLSGISNPTFQSS